MFHKHVGMVPDKYQTMVRGASRGRWGLHPASMLRFVPGASQRAHVTMKKICMLSYIGSTANIALTECCPT